MTLRDLVNWDRPFSIPVLRRNFGQSINDLQEEMNRLFEHFSRGADVYLTDWSKTGVAAPAVNIIENGDSFRVEAALPGMAPEAVEVSVSGNFLTLKGEKKEEKTEEEENYIRCESSFGSFHRQIALPETANCDKAEASFKNGILTIRVPKKAEAVQPAKKLQIKKAA